MGKTIIAIDPGEKGYVTVLQDGEFQFFSIADNDREALAVFINSFSDPFLDSVAIMEEVHAIFGSSAKGTFSFGEIFGFLKGLLIAYGIPYHLVQPKAWQGEIWIQEDKVYRYKHDGKKMVDTKRTSLASARRLFPDVDLKRTPKCKNTDDNKIDSLLICEYARRKNI